MKVGSCKDNNGIYKLTVWAPGAKQLRAHTVSPEDEYIDMQKINDEYWEASLSGAGVRYFINVDGKDFPDPASGYQPEGVHGASEVVNHSAYPWNDAQWKGITLPRLIIYELHTGTFTEEGTFESAIEKLDYLLELGITAVEIMPISQFPGKRNWGYDGVYPFAPQNSYGGPTGLKKLIDACHQKNIAVIMDVVYNHFGPEGNYITNFAPYFTDEYKTPWGTAVNFDEEYSNGVRNYFLQNAINWFVNYHVDGLRLDAIDKIYDLSAKHFLQELAENIKLLNEKEEGKKFLIAESDLSDEKIIRPMAKYGYGVDAQWADDIHHALHSLITKENAGYYMDYGTIEHLADAYKNSFVYRGGYSRFRKRNHGNSPVERAAYRFIVCSQNHDQIGNRAMGERLSSLMPFEALKTIAGLIILSPYIPLLFMGEEYGEEAPFLYFTDHSDKDLNQAIVEGRKKEFASFNWSREVPNPTVEDTFNKSKLNWNLKDTGKNRQLFEFYKQLISLRKTIPALAECRRDHVNVQIYGSNILTIERYEAKSRVFMIFNFGGKSDELTVSFPEGTGKKIIDSSEERWGGCGSLMPATTAGSGSIKINQYSFSLYGMELFL